MSSPSSLNRNASLRDESDFPREESSSLLGRETPPMIRRAHAAFQRDLPLLIKNHRHRWVAYHGDRRVAIGCSKRQLFQQCRHQDLPPEEFMVRLIEPEIPGEIDWNESRGVSF
ncbi:MAG: hypothetical protein WB773_05510 [Isosphaeraceae bacterium]|jgi:hypothetical protein